MFTSTFMSVHGGITNDFCGPMWFKTVEHRDINVQAVWTAKSTEIKCILCVGASWRSARREKKKGDGKGWEIRLKKCIKKTHISLNDRS